MKHTRLDHLARGVLAASALAAPVLLAPASAGAQGFGLNEIGTCSVMRAGAGVAAPCQDASRIYWNPAAAVRLEGVDLLVGAAAVLLNGSFQQDVTGTVYPGDVPVEVPPHLFATYRVLPRFSVGLGVYVPYGLTSQWEETFPGRFSALKASLATPYIQPNFAFDVVPGRFSIGGGPVFGIAEVELQQSIDLASTPTGQALPDGTPITFGMLGFARGTEFARATIHGHDLAVGFNVGAHWQVTDAVSLGARYLSELDFEFNGGVAEFEQIETGLILPANGPITGPDGRPLPGGTPLDAVLAPQFRYPAPLSRRITKTAIPHPAQAQVGLGIRATDALTLNLDYAWVGWSAFQELPVDFQSNLAPGTPDNPAATPPDRVLIEDYEDSWAVRGSVDYVFGNGWTGRLGSSYVKTPVPDVSVTPLLPDMDRYNFAGGVSIPFGNRYALDLGYLRVETPGRRGRIVERESREQTAEALNSGWYSLNANIVSVSFKADF
jgi:long-chain fatty acid transport protein